MIKEILFGTPICFNPGGKGVQYWANCFNGTFSDGKPISIMINNGKVIQDNSCHYIWEYPETVFYIKKDGSFGSKRVQTYTQIEGYKDIVFAIGGVGLNDYNPESEGFCEFERVNIFNKKKEKKDFSDVLDRTNHSVFGVCEDRAFASIMYGTGEEVAAECKKRGFKHCVMGDGRSWAAANTDDLKLNMSKIQYSLVQMTKLIKYELPQLEEPVDKPVDNVSKNVFKLSDLKNPHTPIIPGGHFYWDEYLQNNLTYPGYENYNFNVIESPKVMYEVVFHAMMMEDYRKRLGRSVNATSGHRPDIYNDVILIKLGYKSTKTSDHKYNDSAALDTDVPATNRNINIWKEVCNDWKVSWSIGMYSWGLHLGYRRNKEPRLWDWR